MHDLTNRPAPRPIRGVELLLRETFDGSANGVRCLGDVPYRGATFAIGERFGWPAPFADGIFEFVHLPNYSRRARYCCFRIYGITGIIPRYSEKSAMALPGPVRLTIRGRTTRSSEVPQG